MHFDDLLHSRYFQLGFGGLAVAGATTVTTPEADAQESYREYVQRTQRDPEPMREPVYTYYDEERGMTVSVPKSELPLPLERGPVSNSDFYVQGGLRPEAGVPLTSAFSDGTGRFAGVALSTEAQVYIFAASADFTVTKLQARMGEVDGTGWGEFKLGDLQELDFRANLIGGDWSPWNLAAPRVLEIDNEGRLAAALKYLPGEQGSAWLPGVTATLPLVDHGPLGTMVSLDTSVHLDPELFKDGTYLPRLFEVTLRDGWYLGETTGSVQADIVAYAGIRGEVVEQSPKAPLRDLDERVSTELVGGVDIILRLGSPQKKEPSPGR